MTRRNKIILLVTTVLCGALALTAVRAHDAPRVATGFVAHTLCSAAFVSGLDPDQVFTETLEAMPGVGADHLGVRLPGRSRSPGCHDDACLAAAKAMRSIGRVSAAISRMSAIAVADASLPTRSQPRLPRASLPEIAGPSLVAPATPQLARRSTAPSLSPTARRSAAPRRWSCVKDGHVVAERYAPGYGIDTPILGFSATKSVISALDRHSRSPGQARGRSAGAGCGMAERRTIRGTRSPSTNCCGTPRGSRWAVRCRPRSAARSNRSIG